MTDFDSIKRRLGAKGVIVDDSLKHIDQRLLVDNAVKLDELLTLYPAVQNFIRRNGFTFNAKRGHGFDDVAELKRNRDDTNIELSLIIRHFVDYTYHVNHQGLAVIQNKYMPFDFKQITYYAMCHEFGHLTQYAILNFHKQYSLEWYDIMRNAKRAMTITERDTAISKIIQYNDTKKKEIMEKIIALAKNNNPWLTEGQIMGHLSKLASHKENLIKEFFAEVFANAHGGQPNILGEAMLEFLRKEWE
jgi:hypothetical protein